MTINNEAVWQQAENLAQVINEAYQNRKSIEASNRVGEKLEHAIERINLNIEKREFVGVCTVISEYMPSPSDKFTKAVFTATQLSMESETENKDLSFEMFITCLRFHLAFYKSKWCKEEQKEV